MSIKDLPKPGINFKATSGPGSFKRKLSNATRFGELKNLRDNQKAIVGGISNPIAQRAIRTGGLSMRQQRNVWLKIRASDKTITKEDRREIKGVLKHLGRGATATQGPINRNATYSDKKALREERRKFDAQEKVEKIKLEETEGGKPMMTWEQRKRLSWEEKKKLKIEERKVEKVEELRQKKLADIEDAKRARRAMISGKVARRMEESGEEGSMKFISSNKPAKKIWTDVGAKSGFAKKPNSGSSSGGFAGSSSGGDFALGSKKGGSASVRPL